MIYLLCLFMIVGEPDAGSPLTVVIGGSPPVPRIDDLSAGEVFCSDSSIAELQESILQWYLEKGYPFAGAGFYFISGDTLSVNVVPGRHASLEEVRIEGAPGTDPRVFSRLLDMKPGDPYDPAAVKRWLRRLERLEFIDHVGPTSLFLGEFGNLVLFQELQEGSPGHFAASMGWKGEELDGGGEVILLNLAGTARELEISGQTTTWGGFDAYLRYREPWLFNMPLSVQLEASQETPESAWVNRDGNIALIYDLDRIQIMGGVGLWRGYPPDGSTEKYNYGIAGISSLAGRPVPQGWLGAAFQFQARVGSRTGGDSTGVLSLVDLKVDGHWFRGFLGLGGELMTGGVIQGDWFEGLLENLGGQETLRGYPDNAFRAVRYIVARPEISIGETGTRAYVFCDVAAIRTPFHGIRYPAGAGAGIRGRSGIFHADAAAGFAILEGFGSARLYLKLAASI